MRPPEYAVYNHPNFHGLCFLCRQPLSGEFIHWMQSQIADAMPSSVIQEIPEQQLSADPVRKDPRLHVVECANGHEIPAIYLEGDRVPTFIVALCGLQSTGKTYLLYSLAETAKRGGARLGGFNVRLNDTVSEVYYSALKRQIETGGGIGRTTSGVQMLGLGFRRTQSRGPERGFNLLFVDAPGEFFGSDRWRSQGNEETLGYIPVADAVILTLPGDRLAQSIHESTMIELDTTAHLSGQLDGDVDSINHIAGRVESSWETRQHAARWQDRIPGVVAITKADRLDDALRQHWRLPIMPIFADRGTVPLSTVPVRTRLGGTRYAIERSFDLTRQLTEDDYSALSWRSAYGRSVLSTFAPGFLAAADDLLEASLVTAFSSIGRDPGSDGTVDGPLEPWGVLGLVATLLMVLGQLPPPSTTYHSLLQADLELVRGALSRRA